MADRKDQLWGDKDTRKETREQGRTYGIKDGENNNKYKHYLFFRDADGHIFVLLVMETETTERL